MGSYYLFHGGSSDRCPYASCSNAKVGQEYTPGFAVKGQCPTQNCTKKPPKGFEFVTAGSCDVAECTNGRRGTYYTTECKVDTCTNGNARSVCVYRGGNELTIGYLIIAPLPQALLLRQSSPLTLTACSTYYVPGFNTDPDNCAIKDCGVPPPPGMLFAEAKGVVWSGVVWW